MTVVSTLETDIKFKVDQASTDKAKKAYEWLQKAQAELAKGSNSSALVNSMKARMKDIPDFTKYLDKVRAPAKPPPIPGAAPGNPIGPALPGDYNKGVAEAKAAIIRAQQAANDQAQARKELGLVEPEKQASGWGILKGAVGAFLALQGVQRIQAFSHELMDQASQIDHLATRLGISTEAVQELQYAANDADVSTETLTTALRTLQVQSENAKKGSKETAASFRDLGIGAKEAADLPVDELLERVADGLQRIPDASKRAALAQRLLGRAGGELIPLLKDGSAGLRELREEAVKLGGGLSDEALEAAGNLEKQTKKLDFAMKSLKGTIATAVLPAMTRLFVWGQKVAAFFVDLEKHTNVLGVAIGVVLVGAVTKAGFAFAAMDKAARLAFANNVWSAAKFLLIAAAIAAIVILVEDVQKALTGGKSIIGEWIDSWAGLGTVDSLVRSIATGLEVISKLGFGAAVKEAIGGTGDILSKQKDVNSFKQATEWANSDDPALAEVGRRTLADLSARGVDASTTAGPQMINRALGRGVGASVAKIDSGRVGFGSNSRYGGDVNNVVGKEAQAIIDASVTVNVQNANGTPEQIKNAVADGQTKSAAKVRAALVPEAAK